RRSKIAARAGASARRARIRRFSTRRRAMISTLSGEASLERRVVDASVGWPPMRLFVVGSNLPLGGHPGRASPVVLREALAPLRSLGHEVVFQPLLPLGRPTELSAEEHEAVEWTRRSGIELLDIVRTPVGDPRGGRRRLVRESLVARPHLFNPAYLLRDEFAERVARSGAEVVIHVYSPQALAACSAVDRPVFAYYGTPDPRPGQARPQPPALFHSRPRSLRNHAQPTLHKPANRNNRRVNVRLMAPCRWSANTGATDAAFFAQAGHPNAFYIQNMWTDHALDGATAPVDEEEGKIAGNLGGLDATGNTFGLWYLAREVLPELDRRLRGKYAVHLYGPRQPLPSLARALDHPAVRFRGFVDDIDAELRSAKVFLMTNNT